MAAYNPKGRERVPSGMAAQEARDEGYLFWLAWVSHNTDSLFSTSDSQGPFRRALLGFTCDTLRQQVAGFAGNPNFGPLGPTAGNALLGITDLVGGPSGICAPGNSPPLKKTAAAKAGVAGPTGVTGPTGLPKTPRVPDLPALPGVPSVPGLPTLPSIPPTRGGGATGGLPTDG